MSEEGFTGPIDPWAESASDKKLTKKWSEFTNQYGVDLLQYPTPFCVMRDLLDRWTMRSESKTTAECDDGERLKRLFEVIGGYPMIGGGYRPLDFPAHPLAIPALTLSLYLDTIPLQDPLFGWQSVRSHALIENLNLKNRHGNNVGGDQTDILKKLTGFLVNKVCEFERAHGECRYLDSELTNEERRFLNVLHSTSNNRKGFWEAVINGKGQKSLNTQDAFSPAIRINYPHLSNAQEKSIADYNYHVFKFSGIQSWIHKWGEGIDIGNITQNFTIGPSVMIESIFVRLRSFILQEYGVGSICIDGGGRFSFWSKENTSDVKQSIRDFLLKSLIQVKENIAHPHPYNTLIIKEMKKYIHAFSSEKDTEWERIATEIAESDGGGPPDLHERDGNRPRWQRIIRHFIGEKQMEKWLPDYEDEHANEEVKTKTCTHQLNATLDETAMHKSKDCRFCNFSNQEKKPKNLGSKNSHEACAMHWLLFKIAGDSKIRNSSLSSQLGPPGGLWTSTKIRDIIVLDGNCLGNIFKKPFDWEIEKPVWEEGSVFREIDPDKIDKLLRGGRDIYNTPHECMKTHLEEWVNEIKNISDDSNHEDQFQLVPKRARLNSVVRMMRRSFDFNANWHLAFQMAILSRNRNLTPWVYAGDDIVLVNRMDLTEEDISNQLSVFHQQLQTNLPKCNISFAGGWVKLAEESLNIPDALDFARLNEKISKHTWKQQISEDEQFSDLLGERSTCEVCSEAGSSWLQKQRADLFRFSGERGPHSLILKLNQSDTSPLFGKDPVIYQK